MTQLTPHLQVPCAGVPITSCTRDEAAEEVVRIATGSLERGVDVHLCNAYTLALADKQPALKTLLRAAAINFPDGKSVVWANQLVHRKRGVPSNRVYGPDLFQDVLSLGLPHQLRHYLLGSTPDVLDQLHREVTRRYPGVVITGSESPPFRPLSDSEASEQVERVRSSGAQVVWLGLGTPKQDWEAASLAARLPVVVCAVGAAFDFLAGTKKQAPVWLQDRGLEWAYRLATEPRRLWKRYLFGNARFLRAALVNRDRS
jgi:exopolysaccharide biosynthesis WecB/TagA/CpsF family protein